MANEITFVEQGDPDQVEVQALFYYPISSIEQETVGGSVVVPTPSTDLPPTGQKVLSSSRKTALDNGEAAFEVVSLGVQDMTGSEIRTALSNVYSSRRVRYMARYHWRYGLAGEQVDA